LQAKGQTPDNKGFSGRALVTPAASGRVAQKPG
jgi:hypothetical protein